MMRVFECQIGWSAGRRVAMGFAPACTLYELSFADILVEETGRGYQRRFNAKHSLDFRRYIQSPLSSTIPLTFNLRPNDVNAWSFSSLEPGSSVMTLRTDCEKVLVQVDCQHRLGHLDDLNITLPYMSFIGLSQREEMEIFSVINGKARGLSNSLLDYHAAALAHDLGSEKPELYVALQLNSDPESPWYGQLDLGGEATTGTMRRASLRTMQKAVKKFLTRTQLHRKQTTEEAARVIQAFWAAVAEILHLAWHAPRSHVLNKGVGVYALMVIAADLYEESTGQRCDKRYFMRRLSEFATELDWRQKGQFDGLGGEAGVKKLVDQIREQRQLLVGLSVQRGQ